MLNDQVVEWALVAIPLLFLLLRLFARGYRRSRLTVTDILITLTWLVLACMCTCDIILEDLGFMGPTNLYYGTSFSKQADAQRGLKGFQVS